MKLSFLATLLLVLGGLNCGFIGIFGLDVFEWVFGPGPDRAMYGLVGLAAVYKMFFWKDAHSCCQK